MKYILFLSLLITYGCSLTLGSKYFEYDEIEHYKSDYEESIIGELYDNQTKSKIDYLKYEVVLGEIPKTVSDTTFLKYLDTFGYTKLKVDSKKFSKIDEVFTEKKHLEVYATACEYVYRDILVFKKKSKIIGIAKICFGCDDSVIVGTNANTEEFGMSGDYAKLKKILEEK
jgi:hypothetical protein